MNFGGELLLKSSSAFFDSVLYYMMSKILDLDGSNIRKGGDKVTKAVSALLLVCLRSCVLAQIIDSCSFKVVCVFLGHEKQTRNLRSKMAFKRQAYMQRGWTVTKNLWLLL